MSLGLPYEYSVFLVRSCGVGVSGFVTFVILVSGILDEEVSLSYVGRVGVKKLAGPLGRILETSLTTLSE